MKKHEKIIISKIKTYAEQAILFKECMTFEEFSADPKTISACVFNLSQIGELVTRLDSSFLETNSHIPWHKMRGMRNRIIHDYEGIQLNIVWDVLVDFLPELIKDINDLELI
jgi:uncharacterized protein with HEPN domain